MKETRQRYIERKQSESWAYRLLDGKAQTLLIEAYNKEYDLATLSEQAIRFEKEII